MATVDIIIATYNGGKRLEKTLQSLSKIQNNQNFTSQDWQIIVANNMSTDNTQQIAESFSNELPLTIFKTIGSGKSKALNEAINHIKSPLVVFTDDDVEFDINWISELIKCANNHPEFDFFGGNISGNWEKELDKDLLSWIPINSTYALHLNTVSGPIVPDQIWGPNMMFRKSIFDAGHRFNEKIGPTPDAFYAMGEDSEFCKRLSKLGYKSYYCYEAKIFHTIKAQTANESWIVRRAERLGYGIFASDIDYYKLRLSEHLPIWLDVLLLRIIYTVLFPVANIMPKSKKMFWWKWCYFFYKGLWKSYIKFILKINL
jgi:glycosyltransferase involved in cell wall biosynthesis